ncbi:hypothetical protein PR048_004875 [Dryococelus australis]|uniref:Uncharacterized protein n=1 Tax=Dryococelus australis TaxID=614101 RepID=A0ABQ9I6N9_9NEOP|nr:hypothetical protein PR048_004875 [Dryococelus australis]
MAGCSSARYNSLQINSGGKYEVVISLSIVLGFAENYIHIRLSAKQELVIIFGNTHWNFIYNTANNEEGVTFELCNKVKNINITFRLWGLESLTTLPSAQKIVWSETYYNKYISPILEPKTFKCSGALFVFDLSKQDNTITNTIALFNTFNFESSEVYTNESKGDAFDIKTKYSESCTNETDTHFFHIKVCNNIEVCSDACGVEVCNNVVVCNNIEVYKGLQFCFQHRPRLVRCRGHSSACDAEGCSDAYNAEGYSDAEGCSDAEGYSSACDVEDYSSACYADLNTFEIEIGTYRFIISYQTVRGRNSPGHLKRHCCLPREAVTLILRQASVHNQGSTLAVKGRTSVDRRVGINTMLEGTVLGWYGWRGCSPLNRFLHCWIDTMVCEFWSFEEGENEVCVGGVEDRGKIDEDRVIDKDWGVWTKHFSANAFLADVRGGVVGFGQGDAKVSGGVPPSSVAHEILRQTALSSLVQLDNPVFQQVNARPHTALWPAFVIGNYGGFKGPAAPAVAGSSSEEHLTSVCIDARTYRRLSPYYVLCNTILKAPVPCGAGRSPVENVVVKLHQYGECTWSQNFLDVSPRRQGSFNNHQWGAGIVGNGASHHDAYLCGRGALYNEAWITALTRASPDWDSAVVSTQVESRIKEETFLAPFQLAPFLRDDTAHLGVMESRINLGKARRGPGTHFNKEQYYLYWLLQQTQSILHKQPEKYRLINVVHSDHLYRLVMTEAARSWQELGLAQDSRRAKARTRDSSPEAILDAHRQYRR